MSAGARLSHSALGADYQFAPSADEMDWQLKGLCRTGQYPPQAWTPDPPKVQAKSRQAVAVCRKCPVIEQCREWAMLHGEVYGVWGGLTEDERAVLRGDLDPNHIRRDHGPLVRFYAAS